MQWRPHFYWPLLLLAYHIVGLEFQSDEEEAMSTNPIDYEAVIADLEAKKAQLDSAIQAIRAEPPVLENDGVTEEGVELS